MNVRFGVELFININFGLILFLRILFVFIFIIIYVIFSSFVFFLILKKVRILYNIKVCNIGDFLSGRF